MSSKRLVIRSDFVEKWRGGILIRQPKKNPKCHYCPRTDALRYAFPLVEEDGRILDNRAGAKLCPDCYEENDRRLEQLGILENKFKSPDIDKSAY